MLTVFVSLRELPRYPNEAFTICLSPIIHLVCPSCFKRVTWKVSGNRETFLQLCKRKQNNNKLASVTIKQDNKGLAYVFRRPEIFFGSTTTFTFLLDRCNLALSGLCFVRSVFSLFQDDFATKTLNWTMSNLVFFRNSWSATACCSQKLRMESCEMRCRASWNPLDWIHGSIS